MSDAVRRVVSINDARGLHSMCAGDGPALDVRTDPTRPGLVDTYVWATDSTPVALDRSVDTARLLDTGLPPANGSLCRVLKVPPDGMAHPPMTQRQTLDFCIVLDGDVTLVLDTEEVHLQTGDTVVQRGTRHAWSNRSNRPCTLFITSHDGAW
jgi:mannose-6-phosphate isomerase-like protein (cupin superfamily)